MFSLGLNYLNGWSMASEDGARKQRAEWPPHPDRIFMALAAAWFETGEDSLEGKSLRWLETLPPPEISASDACKRATVLSYVPVNDNGGGRKSSPKTRIDKLRNKGLAVIPEDRLRQPRNFPVAVPHDPRVYLIWADENDDLKVHRTALERLIAKVTHVGHSASFVQMWLEDNPPPPVWIPTSGITPQRLRVTSPGRLRALKKRMNRTAWIAYHDLEHAIKQAKADLKEMKPPPRVAWKAFADVVLLAEEPRTKQHSEYIAAKTGNAVAAANLVSSLVEETGIATVRALISEVNEDDTPILVCASAYEGQGFNAIPAALAEFLSKRLNIPFDATFVQTNVVSHTGADGYGRLGRQAAFGGTVQPEQQYVMVDDFVGQGGTLANLRGWIESKGGAVVGAIALTGKPYSAKLNPSQEQLHELRQKHGPDLEKWWKAYFGHAFDCLTYSEARYLARSPDVDTIRNRLAAAVREGGGRSHGRSSREQRHLLRCLKARKAAQFPNGQPASLRPTPNRWQGYDKPQKTIFSGGAGSVFDPNLIVLGVKGKRMPLVATLKLTAALRGLLMGICPEQPPPEWFTGHCQDGTPTTEPHLALMPLPFVGSEHADGRIMGLAIALPFELDRRKAGICLEPFLRDSITGLPREHTLFDGQRFELAIEMENRERPPHNLNPDTWTRMSRVWASVTPVVLNRHFKGKNKWEQAAESVKDACLHIGLPRPCEVLLHPVALVEGVPHAREYPQLMRKNGGGHRSHSHAVIVFDEPVRGPVLLGAGRFRGYGLCRPIHEKD